MTLRRFAQSLLTLPRFAQSLSIQWFHQIGKCAGTPMLSNCSKNMHSRGPTEQHLCALEPHRGCLLKVKKVSWYPLIIEGQQSHKYAIASPVEPMNLLSKVSNESLPKYRSTIWKNGLVPPCSILLEHFKKFREICFARVFSKFKYLAKKFILTESSDHVL